MGLALQRSPWFNNISETEIKGYPPIKTTQKYVSLLLMVWGLLHNRSPLYSLVEIPDFLPGLTDKVMRPTLANGLGEIGSFITGEKGRTPLKRF